MSDTIYIDGVKHRVHRCHYAGNGWVQLICGQEHGPASLAATVPLHWYHEDSSSAVYTGGHWHSWRPPRLLFEYCCPMCDQEWMVESTSREKLPCPDCSQPIAPFRETNPYALQK